ncbi:ribonuclease HII [Aneurinibacillus sp. Ricciae_BoGa-3]|uniref:ribonuclease HII n=1 Tax=Aneurinibacillus sp. Ricciae_BoGa-3 TaxID=3022697 RepID=UPI00234016AD|nr:ribonuclease HII [Aneurinibacillus sp. Ricciae_BoGa-3]WCK56832.1 ribonuclease HII [Aneurinibacillus sp. Ricciae_BoGa-3]
MHKMTIKDIKNFLDARTEIAAQEEDLLRADDRTGVKAVFSAWEKRKDKESALRARWEEMSRIERELWASGHAYIAGIDEVGRGPLAGPVVTAAVVLPQNFYLPGLNDSKKVPERQRREMYAHITANAVAYCVTSCGPDIIDQINIYQATLRAMAQAVANLAVTPSITLNDAVKIPHLTVEQRPIIGGDGKSISIAAASIVAKVERDAMMAEYDKQFPGYGFAANMGYGTAEHLAALRRLGPTPIHRRSFARVINE